MAVTNELSEISNAIVHLGVADGPPSGVLAGLLTEGARSRPYTALVARLCDEVRACWSEEAPLEERVHPTAAAEDAQTFVMELAGFLKALGCPHPELCSAADRLSRPEHHLLLLRYLVSEVQSARMLAVQGGGNDASGSDGPAKMQISESANAAVLREMCQALGLSRPPPSVTEAQLFDKLKICLTESITAVGANAVGRPLFSGTLTEQQWRLVDSSAEALNKEYTVRAELLLKRVDVTVQSFAWSDRVKRMEEQLVSIYRPRRQKLLSMTHITVADLLAARASVLHVEKTSSSSVLSRTKTKLQKLLIKGRVPDRGGRTDEMQAPPPEMPAWQQRTAPPGGGFGAGRAGGGRGGRHQSPRGGKSHRGGGGGFQQQQPYQQQQQFQQQQQQYQQPGYVQHDFRSAGGGGYQQQGQYNAYGGGGAAQYGQPPVGMGQGYNQGGNYLVGGGGQAQMAAQYVDPYAQQAQSNYDQFAMGYNQQFNQHGYQNQHGGGRSYGRGGGGRGRRY